MRALKEMDFKSGKIVFLAPLIDFHRPFTEQLDALSEDLVQVTYGADCILDIGWYPEGDEKGSLTIQVIENQNWDLPIFQKSSREKNSFFDDLATAIDVAEGIKERAQ